MKLKLLTILLLASFVLVGCSTKDHYVDIFLYHDQICIDVDNDRDCMDRKHFMSYELDKKIEELTGDEQFGSIAETEEIKQTYHCNYWDGSTYECSKESYDKQEQERDCNFDQRHCEYACANSSESIQECFYKCEIKNAECQDEWAYISFED